MEVSLRKGSKKLICHGRLAMNVDDPDLLQFVSSHRSASNVLDCLSPGRLIYKVEKVPKRIAIYHIPFKRQWRMHGVLTDLLDTCLKVGLTRKNMGFHGHDDSILVILGVTNGGSHTVLLVPIPVSGNISWKTSSCMPRILEEWRNYTSSW